MTILKSLASSSRAVELLVPDWVLPSQLFLCADTGYFLRNENWIWSLHKLKLQLLCTQRHVLVLLHRGWDRVMREAAM
jgi:hypothetical protein